MADEIRKRDDWGIKRIYDKYYGEGAKKDKVERKHHTKRGTGKLAMFAAMLKSGSYTKEQLLKETKTSPSAFHSALWYLKKQGLTIIKNGEKYTAK